MLADDGSARVDLADLELGAGADLGPGRDRRPEHHARARRASRRRPRASADGSAEAAEPGHHAIARRANPSGWKTSCPRRMP